jgi:hypothetical protein
MEYRSLSPLLTQSSIHSNESSHVTSSQRRAPDHLARPDGGRYQHAFETDNGHYHGPYEPATPEHTINLEGAKLETTITRSGLGQQDPPRVRSRSRSRSTLHRPDGKVPGPIQQRKLLCHVVLHKRLQLHQSRPNEVQVRLGVGQSI